MKEKRLDTPIYVTGYSPQTRWIIDSEKPAREGWKWVVMRRLEWSPDLVNEKGFMRPSGETLRFKTETENPYLFCRRFRKTFSLDRAATGITIMVPAEESEVAE